MNRQIDYIDEQTDIDYIDEYTDRLYRWTDK